MTACANEMGGGPVARPRVTGGSGIHAATGFVALLALLLPLRDSLCFNPSAVVAGQWWRVVTHPFVHVSWYHLLLDGAAFLLLYHGLERHRLRYVAATGAGSLLASLWFWPAIGTTGLCGLSGIAHGLMAVMALELIHRGDRLGWSCLALVAGKAIWEGATGHVVFEGLHSGLIGTPVAVCHFGGVIGGAIAFAMLRGMYPARSRTVADAGTVNENGAARWCGPAGTNGRAG
jgi:rhomboid family GlyGly-CTERM serine protease